MKNKLLITRIVLIAFMFIGLIGWLTPFLVKSFDPYTELPLSEPHGIGIDNEENLYCASKFYGRVQKYNKDGKFIRGFDTKGGTEMGSDFGFYINDEDNLCILTSGLGLSKKDSLYILRTYNSEGNEIHIQRYTKAGTDYFYPVLNKVTDSLGNYYIFKGFLFPRVIKETQLGNRSVIIRSPLQLWLFQAPFPAFGFFFVSMFIMFFLMDESALWEAIKEHLQQKGKLKRMTIYVSVVCILTVAVVYLIFLGAKTYPATVIVGIISLGVMVIITGLLCIVYAFRWSYHLRKYYPDLFQVGFDSVKQSIEHSKAVKSTTANDTVLLQIKTNMIKTIKLCVFIWLLTYSIIVFIIVHYGPFIK